MELRDIARRIVLATSIDEKLRAIEPDFTDESPGPAERLALPGRPARLQFAARRSAPAMPAPEAFRDPLKRGLAHHILANHELQALEAMAWALLAFPDAPADFRRGLVEILADEQRHTRMHIERAARLGVAFGDWPVNGYIWSKSMEFQSLLEYLAGLPLVFEGANLDHALEFAAAFETAGDERSAALMRTIHRDEIRHVAFGLDWLRRLKPTGQSDWEAFTAHLHWPLRAAKARGTVFQRAARLEAGMSADFVDRLAAAGPDDVGPTSGTAGADTAADEERDGT